ncbi:hypothetical protein GIB67_011735 [Kingdonia uniflora]|uniref:BRX domain-containing protein n=1 Tax=Kingdonia uniflora TaxID=39325 RepID=A0A7J7LUD7_9MAGN|nr:hypothetical protein GIB67_011735 [Kingdonia uniflora]
MLQCIACSSVDEGEGGGGTRGTSSTKEPVKSLTSQIKEMALRFSGAYRQCKPCTGSSSYKKGQGSYPDFETVSGGIHNAYSRGPGGNSTSSPVWNIHNINSLPLPSEPPRYPNLGRHDEIDDVVVAEDGVPKEWVALVEPGVHITFMALPEGGNDLKRIRFDRDFFNKWQAQRWWGENYDRVLELYNVQRFSRQSLQTPARSEDERDSSYSRMGSARESPITQQFNQERLIKNNCKPSSSKGVPSNPIEESDGHIYAEPCANDASRTTTSSRDEGSRISLTVSEQDREWIQQDEPGVYITIRESIDGSRELKRVRFSRELFAEAAAKLWWDENRDRIHAQYL